MATYPIRLAKYTIIFQLKSRNNAKKHASRFIFRKVESNSLADAKRKAFKSVNKKYGRGYYVYCDYYAKENI